MSGSTHRFLLPFSAACLFLFVVCGCQRPEAPSTVVTTELDKVCNTDGLISLREAISYAEEGDRITFGEEIPGGTIMELRHGSLKIKKVHSTLVDTTVHRQYSPRPKENRSSGGSSGGHSSYSGGYSGSSGSSHSGSGRNF